MTTEEVDKKFAKFLVKNNACPNIEFSGFPKALCASVNNTLCHGIPNSRKIQEGDYINFDMTCYFKGMYGDTSLMATFGKIPP